MRQVELKGARIAHEVNDPGKSENLQGFYIDQRRSAATSNLPQATLQFLPGWREIQRGDIHAGAKLVIEYDPERLSTCRMRWRGAEVWDIEVFVRCHRGGQLFSGSVLEKIRVPPESGMVVALVPKAYEITIPAQAIQLELWFRNFYQVSSSCEAWDSRYGQNYWYDVVRG